MPLTFLRYFCIGSTLRWFISSTQWPDHQYFYEMQRSQLSAFGSAFSHVRGLREGTDDFTWKDKKQSTLTEELYRQLLCKINASSTVKYSPLVSGGQLLQSLRDRLSPVARLPTTIVRVKSLKRAGVVFGTAARSSRNSYVLFKKQEGVLMPKIVNSAGRITDIFYHRRLVNGKERIEPFFVISAYSRLAEHHFSYDLWRHIPGLDTELYYNHLEDEVHLVGLEDVISHFAAYTYTPHGINSECMLVRSLDRVSF